MDTFPDGHATIVLNFTKYGAIEGADISIAKEWINYFVLTMNLS